MDVSSGALLAAHREHQRLAAALCGVEDQPFSVDWPTNGPEAENFLRDYPGTFAPLDGAPPEKLRERVTRLWLLYLRARIEIKFAK